MAGEDGNGAGVVQILRVDIIKIDGGTQARHAMCETTIDDYAEAMREGIEFPPIIVYFDGVSYWLADGFHRYLARKRAELLSISAEVVAGSRRDAVLFAAGANANHGLRRSSKDKRRAIRLLIADEEWSKKTDRWIAAKCAVGHGLVASVRSELRGDGQATEETREARDGSTIRVTPVTPVREREASDAPSQRTSSPQSNQPARNSSPVAAQPLDGAELYGDDADEADAAPEQSATDEWLGNEDDPVSAGLAEAKEFDRLIKQITSVYPDAKKLADGYGGAFLDDNKLNELRAKLQNAAQVLRDTKPHCECGYCHGNGVACKQCRSSGYLTKVLAADMPQAEAAAV